MFHVKRTPAETIYFNKLISVRDLVVFVYVCLLCVFGRANFLAGVGGPLEGV